MNKYALITILSLLPGLPAHAATLAVFVNDAEGKPLADTVIYLQADTPTGTLAGNEIRIEQKGKEFHPFVSVAPVGTVARFPNRDGIGHHVYSFSPAKTFELPLSETESLLSVTFDKPGIITVGCNIHDWMVGYIQVIDTPYYGITGAEGELNIDNIPAGNYRVLAWHPGSKAGAAVEQPLIIDGAGPLRQNFTLDIKPEIFWKPPRPPENEEEQY